MDPPDRPTLGGSACAALGFGSGNQHDERVSALTPAGRSAPAYRLGKVFVEDLVPALLYAVLTLIFFSAGISNYSPSVLEDFSGSWPFPLFIGCVAILLRRIQVPLFATVIALCGIWLFLLGNTAGFFLLFEAVFTLVLLGNPRLSRFTEHSALVLTGLLVVLMYFITGSVALTVTTGLLAGATIWMPAEWAGNVRKARDLAVSERQTAEAVAHAATVQSQIQAREHEMLMAEERTSMAREVHDVLSARLSAIALQSGAALNSPHNSELNAKAMEEIRVQSVKGLEELNSMIRMLHQGTPRAPAGTLADIPALVATFTGAGEKVEYSNELPHGGKELAGSVQTALYRAVNESLINFSKHAPNSQLKLELRLDKDLVQFTASNPLVTDDSRKNGMTSASGTGTGLRSMHARSTELGGRFHTSNTGNQFILNMFLPAEELLP